MLKDLKEEWFLKVNGREIPVSVKFENTSESAKKFAREMKKRGYNYRIEHLSFAKKTSGMHRWAGIPHGANYTVAYWKPKRKS